MRIKIFLSSNKELVPFNYQTQLNGVIHKWLGKENEYHDVPSDYNISSLLGGKKSDTKSSIKNKKAPEYGLNFKKGAFLLISSINDQFIMKILRGIKNDPDVNWGMKAISFEVVNEESKFFNGENKFFTLSPILIRENMDEKGKYTFITFESDNANEKITEKMKNKILKINPNIDLSNFQISFDNSPKSIKSRKIKTIMVKNVKNIASACPIIITGSKEAVEICYNVGVGQSTGSGFGCISKEIEPYIFK